MRTMDYRSAITRSAISGIVWGGIGIAVVLLLAPHGESLRRIALTYSGGVLAAPFIGIATGFTSRIFRQARFPGRAALAVITLYLAAFLFVLAAQGTAFVVGRMPHVSFATVLLNSWNATILGLTWTGFVLVLAPLAYLNHLLVSRSSVA